MSGEQVEAYRTALRHAIGAALTAHSQESANVEEGVRATHPNQWYLEITPYAPGAAAAYIALGGGDEVTLGFGETHTYIWDDDPKALGGEVQEIFEAVFAGSFVEAGPKGDSTSKLVTSHGEVLVGAIRLPVPWRLRRTRTYAPYSSPDRLAAAGLG